MPRRTKAVIEAELDEAKDQIKEQEKELSRLKTLTKKMSGCPNGEDLIGRLDTLAEENRQLNHDLRNAKNEAENVRRRSANEREENSRTIQSLLRDVKFLKHLVRKSGMSADNLVDAVLDYKP